MGTLSRPSSPRLVGIEGEGRAALVDVIVRVIERMIERVVVHGYPCARFQGVSAALGDDGGDQVVLAPNAERGNGRQGAGVETLAGVVDPILGDNVKPCQRARNAPFNLQVWFVVGFDVARADLDQLAQRVLLFAADVAGLGSNR